MNSVTEGHLEKNALDLHCSGNRAVIALDSPILGIDRREGIGIEDERSVASYAASSIRNRGGELCSVLEGRCGDCIALRGHAVCGRRPQGACGSVFWSTLSCRQRLSYG